MTAHRRIDTWFIGQLGLMLFMCVLVWDFKCFDMTCYLYIIISVRAPFEEHLSSTTSYKASFCNLTYAVDQNRKRRVYKLRETSKFPRVG